LIPQKLSSGILFLSMMENRPRKKELKFNLLNSMDHPTICNGKEETTSTNGDALVDCIVYANELRKYPHMDRLAGTRRIIPPPKKDASCSITMCGNDDDPSCRLLLYCPNGHYIHDRCLEDMFVAADNLNILVCPQCRSEDMMSKVVTANPMPNPSILHLKCSDRVIVMKALYREFPRAAGGISLLTMIIKGKRSPSAVEIR
jgi:hypothetical protein